MVETQICGEAFHLLAQKALYWPSKKTLLIADLHIGKVGHFRKNGLAVPRMAGQNNLWRLAGLLLDPDVAHLLILGDLFHSSLNAEWDEFEDFIAQYTQLHITLVLGNHDIIPSKVFQKAGIKVLEELVMPPFHFSHDQVETTLYNIHGHIHPGVRLRGYGRQALTLPCFYFGADRGILPSFGDFTGLYKISPKKGDQVFVVKGELVADVS